MRLNFLLLLLLPIIGCTNTYNNIDGVYNRIGQSDIEKQYGMSSILIVSNEGKKFKMRNKWGDDNLVVIKKGDEIFIDLNNKDPSYKVILKNNDDLELIDTYSLNENQKYYFKRQK